MEKKPQIEKLEGIIAGYHREAASRRQYEGLIITLVNGEGNPTILSDPNYDKIWFGGYKVEGPNGLGGLLSMLDAYKGKAEKVSISAYKDKKGKYKITEMEFGNITYKLK